MGPDRPYHPDMKLGPSSEPEADNPNLKKCEACGKPMAKGARTCPHCGKTHTTLGGIFIAIIIGLILAGFLFKR